MKSLIVSVFWPAWVWLERPEWRGLFSAYAGDLALRDSVRCRSILEHPWYRSTFQPQWELSGDQNAKSYFENTRKGFRLSLSVGGKATGFRGDALVVDDPLNAKEQHSEAAREEVKFWWDQVMSSRLNDMRVGAKVVIMQRLHEDDLSGHVLAKGGYEHLCLPTEFEPARRSTTSIGFADPRQLPGELLFPEMFPAPVVDGIKKDLGGAGFAGQHQQRPNPAGGGLFQRHQWRYWQPVGASLPPVVIRNLDGTLTQIEPVEIPEFLDGMAQSWDCAFKGNESADFVAGQVWGRRGASHFLFDQVHERLTFTATQKAIRDLSARWPDALLKLVEDKANGTAVMDSLRQEVPGLVPVEPQGGKYARASAVHPLVEAGNVFVPHPSLAPWVDGFLVECESFPRGAHDDQVDAMTQYLNWSREQRVPLVVEMDERVSISPW